MKILVVGTGYVGLVTGTCLADMGNDVWCVDVNEEKIQILKEGKVPIYEPGLEHLVLDNHRAGRLKFTVNIQEALADSDVCFIAVGTPMGEDGSADLQYVLNVAESVESTWIIICTLLISLPCRWERLQKSVPQSRSSWMKERAI